MRGVIMYGPATSGSKTATSRRSSNPPTRSSASPASCICGSDLWPYRGAEGPWTTRRWVTSTSAWSPRSARR